MRYTIKSLGRGLKYLSILTAGTDKSTPVASPGTCTKAIFLSCCFVSPSLFFRITAECCSLHWCSLNPSHSPSGLIHHQDTVSRVLLVYNFSPHHLFLSGFKKDGPIFPLLLFMLQDNPLQRSAGGLLGTVAEPEPGRTAAERSSVQVGHWQPKHFTKRLQTPKVFLVQSLFWLHPSRGTLPEFQMSYLEVTGQHSGSVKVLGNVYFHPSAWGDGSPGILLPFLAGADFTDGSLLAEPFQSPSNGHFNEYFNALLCFPYFSVELFPCLTQWAPTVTNMMPSLVFRVGKKQNKVCSCAYFTVGRTYLLFKRGWGLCCFFHFPPGLL